MSVRFMSQSLLIAMLFLSPSIFADATTTATSPLSGLQNITTPTATNGATGTPAQPAGQTLETTMPAGNPPAAGPYPAAKAAAAAKTGPAAAQPKTEFQSFVQESTGYLLPLYGHNLFGNTPSTFAPVDHIPVTQDYIIGPGDEIDIKTWGQVDGDVHAIVDRLGAIYIPKVGTIQVAGIKYQDLQAAIKTAIGRVFRNFDLEVNLGQLRSLQIYVVGQAVSPGSYTVSSLSTLVNALFASGGPSAIGSMRHIQLKRQGQIVTEFDVYDFLLKGDKSKDVPLQSGDVIFIPPVGQVVAIMGSVNNSAIYELKDKTDLADLIQMAGGLTATAAGQKAEVDRIESHKDRSVEDFDLDQAGLERQVKDGDLVKVFSISPKFENAVILRGNVASAFLYPAINDTQNNNGTLAGNAATADPYGTTAGNAATADPYGTTAGNAATAARYPRNGGSKDGVLPLSANITPSYRYPWHQGMRVTDLIPNKDILITNNYWLKQNGTDLVGTKATNAFNDIKSPRSEINWDYAVIERLNREDLTTDFIPFNLGKAVLDHDPAQNLALEPGDVVTVFSKTDLAVPIAKQVRLVRIEGEVKNAGIYEAKPGETLRQLVTRIGGLTSNAYLFGAEFTRVSTQKLQQQRLDESINRREQDVQKAAATASQSSMDQTGIDAAKVQAKSQQAALEKLRLLKPTGRIILEIPPGEDSIQDIPDIALENGDRLYIPPVASSVGVFGEVYNENNAYFYKQSKRLTDYLSQAGGPTRDADNGRIFVLRADGSVVSRQSDRGLFSGSFNGMHMMPGDAIVVPEKMDKTPVIKSIIDWTTILLNMGVGLASLKFVGLI